LFAGVHLEAGAVVVDVVGDHGADDAEVVDAACGVGEEFGDFDAGLAVLFEFPGGGEEVAGFGADQLGHFEGEGFAVVAG
jgi:hypothetical protein